MSKVDWSTAPRDTTDYGGGRFWSSGMEGMRVYSGGEWVHTWEKPSNFKDHVSRRYDWPENDERINNIGLNRTEDDMGHYNELREAQSDLNAKPVSAADFLSQGLKILSERGNQYGSNQRECSFPQAAEAFNALTGHNLKGSDICLIIALVKQVRQYAQPSRFHEDSAVDAVNYLALQSELLKKELRNE
jgi:hypothetical protein